MSMTKDQVRRASKNCDAAFQIYISEAMETHRLLSSLSDEVSLPDRAQVMEQRIRENEAQIAYVEARSALFDVLTKNMRAPGV